MIVNPTPAILLVLSPKFKRPMANDPNNTDRFSHDINVLSFAKNTFGSTLTGTAARLACFFPLSSDFLDEDESPSAEYPLYDLEELADPFALTSNASVSFGWFSSSRRVCPCVAITYGLF
ncbi:hypothetical protein AX774_g1591 [Zancudomyces culisetae]|uniref:Uncharacterized protein n=1 Tax=Zancudomyces culisetae TaxID=1213189 RepID=A0A1R1PV72_ZANCU|nr:hypothetical protein AX774_g1591 [Zancudomyces culisetae]|eukprot:OMH84858.1 hypothetical protein AX774_g1591 [Zancudomyces culisetae]